MEVVASHKKLVFAPNTPSEVVRVIPHARAFMHRGAEHVAVHHGVEEAMVLRNMGLANIPAPILSYYNWPSRGLVPMTHQKHTAAFLNSYRRALCLNSPGTGKTLSALWGADFLKQEGVIKKVLIVAPLSTVQSVWGKELKFHLPHCSFQILTGSKERKERLFAIPADFYIINHDGFTAFQSQLTDVDLVIYDEATALKTPSSQRFRIFQKWMMDWNPWLWMLTGTPISQSPIDAWTLARLVQSPSVPRSFTAFRDAVMNRISMYKWVPRSDALETCKRVLQPSIRYSLDECIDLPVTNYVPRETELTPPQQRAYKDMERTAVAVFAKGNVVAANAAVTLGKLLQIACGVVYDNHGGEIGIDASLRYDALLELLDEIGVRQGVGPSEKAIIFVPLRGVQEWLTKALKGSLYEAVAIHGDTSPKDRAAIFHRFQNDDALNILVPHPKVAAHGVDLTRSKHVIWFAPIFSLEMYEQANARISRLTTEGKTTIVHLYATPLEKELYRRLQHKKQVLADFLELVRGVNKDDL
jgi:SNF2 family DNA or RNA helicase